MRRIPLTESIDSLFLSFVHCRHVIRKFAFSLTDDTRLRHLKENKNSSGDEIANVLVNDDIAHT